MLQRISAICDNFLSHIPTWSKIPAFSKTVLQKDKKSSGNNLLNFYSKTDRENKASGLWSKRKRGFGRFVKLQDSEARKRTRQSPDNRIRRIMLACGNPQNRHSRGRRKRTRPNPRNKRRRRMLLFKPHTRKNGNGKSSRRMPRIKGPPLLPIAPVRAGIKNFGPWPQFRTPEHQINSALDRRSFQDHHKKHGHFIQIRISCRKIGNF